MKNSHSLWLMTDYTHFFQGSTASSHKRNNLLISRRYQVVEIMKEMNVKMIDERRCSIWREGKKYTKVFQAKIKVCLFFRIKILKKLLNFWLEFDCGLSESNKLKEPKYHHRVTKSFISTSDTMILFLHHYLLKFQLKSHSLELDFSLLKLLLAFQRQ